MLPENISGTSGSLDVELQSVLLALIRKGLTRGSDLVSATP
jgi:hypothetical protein